MTIRALFGKAERFFAGKSDIQSFYELVEEREMKQI